jgi:hypothetical protein
MSDFILRFIPTTVGYMPAAETHEGAVLLLKELLPDGEMCQAEVYDRLEFIDQGENLECILCPSCASSVILFDGSPRAEAVEEWWYNITDRVTKEGCERFEISMPCCNSEVFFTDLKFEWPAGFARFELSIWNALGDLGSEGIERLEIILQCKLLQIRTHY